jgi:hypothetical protein
LARFDELDDVVHQVVGASMIAGLYLAQGDRKGAERSFIDMLVAAREIGDVVAMTSVLPFEAIAAHELERPESAAMILGAFDTHSRRYGVPLPLGIEQVITAYDPRGRARAALGGEKFDAALRRGGEMTLEETVEYVLDMAKSLM